MTRRAERGGAYSQEAEADCADEFEGGDGQRRHGAAVAVATGIVECASNGGQFPCEVSGV